MVYLTIVGVALVLFVVVLAVLGPRLGFIKSLRPVERYVVLFLTFIVGAPLIAIVLFVVVGLYALISEGGFGTYFPPETLTAEAEYHQGRPATEDSREAATRFASTATATASTIATAKAETTFPVLPPHPAWPEGMREDSNHHLDGASAPCVPDPDALDACVTGRGP